MPPYTIYISPTASNDLTGAVEYYNLQAEDLGYRFADLVEAYLNRIALTPPLRLYDIVISDANLWPLSLTSSCSP